MNYLTFLVGVARPGSIVEVVLSGVESDLFLVDDSNLASMHRGGSFNYTGGHYGSSPVRLAVPSRANWTAVVVPGAGGRVSASARLLA